MTHKGTEEVTKTSGLVFLPFYLRGEFSCLLRYLSSVLVQKYVLTLTLTLQPFNICGFFSKTSTITENMYVHDVQNSGIIIAAADTCLEMVKTEACYQLFHIVPIDMFSWHLTARFLFYVPVLDQCHES